LSLPGLNFFPRGKSFFPWDEQQKKNIQ
jgi:hypothetical protein